MTCYICQKADIWFGGLCLDCYDKVCTKLEKDKKKERKKYDEIYSTILGSDNK